MLKMNRIDMGKIYPLTNKSKKKVFATIQHVKDEIFNMDYLKDYINSNYTLEDIELTKFLNMELNKYYKCLLFNNQFAWISENEYGKQRYFTKGNLTNGLDIYDLLSIYYNCNYSQTFNYLLEMGYTKDNNDRLSNKLKCIQNIQNINNTIENNDNLKKLIDNKVDIYIALNEFAKSNSLSFNKYKDEQIFFVSTRFLKDKYSLDYSISTINQVINLYALIGLVYKIPTTELNNDIYNAYTVNPKKAPVNFYSIPSLDKILDKINKNSFILNEKNINYYDLNKTTFLRLQKINDNELHYTDNNGGGDKTKKAKKLKEEKDSMETLFLYYLDREGVVAKEWIKENKEITLKTTAFNKKWNELIQRNSGRVIKPNKLLMNKYGLKSKQDIFIVKGVGTNE